ncbi:VOC family protein [Streptomyces smaragdinus]|uniref:VOC family protein n=1 Tax=Streptomyces smaragdinus TaxID=2585196 RepID=UPI002B215269|nr:VOC family protein [Streptomyces smaragdinus]
MPPDRLLGDFRVGDLDSAVAEAVTLGATVAEFQPQESVRVLFDPAGHPFCLRGRVATASGPGRLPPRP